MLQDAKPFCIEVNSQVVNLQCVNFQPLQLAKSTKPSKVQQKQKTLLFAFS